MVQFRFNLVELSYILAYGESFTRNQPRVIYELMRFCSLARTADNLAFLTIIDKKNKDGVCRLRFWWSKSNLNRTVYSNIPLENVSRYKRISSKYFCVSSFVGAYPLCITLFLNSKRFVLYVDVGKGIDISSANEK